MKKARLYKQYNVIYEDKFLCTFFLDDIHHREFGKVTLYLNFENRDIELSYLDAPSILDVLKESGHVEFDDWDLFEIYETDKEKKVQTLII